MYAKIVDFQAQIKSNQDKILKLKRNAKYIQNCKEKKQKILAENQEIIQYDRPSYPSLLFKHPELHDHIHNSVKFSSADEKR